MCALTLDIQLSVRAPDADSLLHVYVAMYLHLHMLCLYACVCECAHTWVCVCVGICSSSLHMTIWLQHVP